MGVLSIYETLLAHYGDKIGAPARSQDFVGRGATTKQTSFSPQGGNEKAQSVVTWWPAKTPYEVMVGAVLTQNTAWNNVEKAIANFGENLSPEAVADAELVELTEIIRPAGFFNQKAVYLKAMTTWFEKYNYDVPTVQKEPLSKLRAELLFTKGIGQETADSILLYAFGFPTFVVDAYTMRLCERYPIEAGKNYAAVKAYFEISIPQSAEAYNNFHALIVINAKEHCRKKPLCDGCPLGETCGRCGL